MNQRKRVNQRKKKNQKKKSESKEAGYVKWCMEEREGIIRIVNEKGEEMKAESMMWEMRKV